MKSESGERHNFKDAAGDVKGETIISHRQYRRTTNTELLFDDDPIINNILFDLYGDFLRKASVDGEAASLNYVDELLLELVSSAVFDKMNEAPS